jgi:hypothetical protein
MTAFLELPNVQLHLERPSHMYLVLTCMVPRGGTVTTVRNMRAGLLVQ